MSGRVGRPSKEGPRRFDREEILRLHKSGLKQWRIARRMGCSTSLVNKVIHGRTKWNPSKKRFADKVLPSVREAIRRSVEQMKAFEEA